MRKSAYITLSILLSTMILWIGSGIMTVVCEHTGSVSVAEMPSKMRCKDAAASNCMKMQVKTLSPTNAERADFHQPLPVQFSLLPQLITDCGLLPLPVGKGLRKNMAMALAWSATPISSATYNTFDLIFCVFLLFVKRNRKSLCACFTNV